MEDLAGNNERLRTSLTIELNAGSDFPKTFVWANDDDNIVNPSNARRMAERLTAQGAGVMYKSYPTGGHSCALGEGTSCENWIYDMDKFMKNR